VVIRCIVKTPPMKNWEVMREWRRRIKEEFDRKGIELSKKDWDLRIAKFELEEKP